MPGDAGRISPEKLEGEQQPPQNRGARVNPDDSPPLQGRTAAVTPAQGSSYSQQQTPTTAEPSSPVVGQTAGTVRHQQQPVAKLPLSPQLSGIDAVKAAALKNVKRASKLLPGQILTDLKPPKLLRNKQCAAQLQRLRSLLRNGDQTSRCIRQLQAILDEAETSQRRLFKQRLPRYCHFLFIRSLWYRIMRHVATQSGHHVTTGKLDAAATQVAVDWIQAQQQEFDGLLPPDDVITLVSVDHSDPQPDDELLNGLIDKLLPLLDGFATVNSDAGNADPPQLGNTQSADSRAGVAQVQAASLTPDEERYAQVAVTRAGWAWQSEYAAGQAQQAEPLASMEVPLLAAVHCGSSHWQHRSPPASCGCHSCVAYQTGQERAKDPLNSTGKRFWHLPVRRPAQPVAQIILHCKDHAYCADLML